MDYRGFLLSSTREEKNTTLNIHYYNILARTYGNYCGDIMGYVVLWILMVPRCEHLLRLVQDVVIALIIFEVTVLASMTTSPISAKILISGPLQAQVSQCRPQPWYGRSSVFPVAARPQRATVSAKNPRMIPFRFTTNPLTSEGIRIRCCGVAAGYAFVDK